MTALVGESPVSPRTSFNSSQLIRILESLDSDAVGPSTLSFAEALSAWLDWTNAISLSTTLSAALTGGPARRAQGAEAGTLTGGRGVTEQYSRVRDEFIQSITADATFAADEAPDPLTAAPAQPLAGARQAGPDFSPYRRSYLAHQRAMEARIGALRAEVRAALAASSSTELASLAALDAVMDKALRLRERHLLATVPALLGRHFERSYGSPKQTPARSNEAEPAKPGGRSCPGPGSFGGQMQGVLLAELDIRLHPVQGMIEALASHARSEATGPRSTGANAAAAGQATARP